METSEPVSNFSKSSWDEADLIGFMSVELPGAQISEIVEVDFQIDVFFINKSQTWNLNKYILT